MTALVLEGRLDAAAASSLWERTMRAASAPVAIDISRVTYCDGAGAALVLAAAARARAAGGGEIIGASEDVGAVIALTRKGGEAAATGQVVARPPESLALVVGRGAVNGARGMGDSITFLGEAISATVLTVLRPWTLRWDDTMRHAEEAGTRALPLIVMLGFLFGLILAFQSAIPMRQYGAEIFVANLVAVSVFRELGPLLAAVILAGRSGSAFAAEIGTMKVNEEVDALTTMGLDPFRFLVVPRLIAAIAIMPVLIAAMNLAAVAGMSTVMMSLGFPLVAISNQVVSWTSMGDVIGGVAKGMVFGAVVAGIGCARGMRTGAGPRAVGDSATSAVVGGIVSIVVLDGIFAVIFYLMGW
ncbi:MlaE family ABC transporter permease [Elioraea rosea]|uniref:MlaE family ABC transporter permease n=1 Tax=Elioraea rosea TaxID=2492390 RepID=UPI001186B74B|nr:ABC transporter permease [Elioraea rosea]